jgi:LytS/YehU family sensor histidine kinase
MFIQPFVENAIKHGVNRNDQAGKISVVIELLEKESLLKCEIRDNGNGFEEKENNEHKSISSTIVKERLSIFKKKFNVNSRYTITEKDGLTMITLYLPFIRE